MKKTTILVRGFDCEFEITILRKDFLCVNCAKEYVHKEIAPTAFVRGVIHHDEGNDRTIMNQNLQKTT